MRENPSEVELLKIAYKVLKENLLPELSHQNRYNGLMVARSIEIVIRQLGFESEANLSELELLTHLTQQDGDLTKLNRLLSKKIRENDFQKDSKLSKLILNTLLQISQQKVLESNPKYLKSFRSSSS